MAKRVLKAKKATRPRGAKKKVNPPFPGPDQQRLSKRARKSKNAAKRAGQNAPFPGPDPFRLDK